MGKGLSPCRGGSVRFLPLEQQRFGPSRSLLLLGGLGFGGLLLSGRHLLRINGINVRKGRSHLQDGVEGDKIQPVARIVQFAQGHVRGYGNCRRRKRSCTMKLFDVVVAVVTRRRGDCVVQFQHGVPRLGPSRRGLEFCVGFAPNDEGRRTEGILNQRDRAGQLWRNVYVNLSNHRVSAIVIDCRHVNVVVIVVNHHHVRDGILGGLLDWLGLHCCRW